MQFVYSTRFKKSYRKLSAGMQEKVLERLALLAQDEYHPVLRTHPLHGAYSGYRSINVTGDVRLVYVRDGAVCRLEDIGTHSQLYG